MGEAKRREELGLAPREKKKEKQTSKNRLNKILNKIEQLNQIAEIIKNNPSKKLSLSKCKNHDEVIRLTTEWGFDIGKRWGEY